MEIEEVEENDIVDVHEEGEVENNSGKIISEEVLK